MAQIFTYIMLTAVGLCVGSFCNVLIFRLQKGEEFVKTPSHCTDCGCRLKWYEMIPIFSWLAQRGRCRTCGAHISRQYPIVEALNGAAWLLTGIVFGGDWLHIALYCVLFSALTVLAVLDWRTYEIRNSLIIAVLILGAVQFAADLEHWPTYIIGLCSVSVLFLLIWLLTHGAGMGMGDVLLMAAAGLLLGWQRILLAVIIGTLAAIAIHGVRMLRGADHKLAYGPYLSAGIWISAIFGQGIISAYLSLFGL